MQDATIARGEDVTANVRGDEDTFSWPLPSVSVKTRPALVPTTSTHLLQGQRDPKPSGAPGEKHIAKQR